MRTPISTTPNPLPAPSPRASARSRSCNRPAAAPAMNIAATTPISAQPSPAGARRKCPGPAAHASAARLTQTTPTAVHSADESRGDDIDRHQAQRHYLKQKAEGVKADADEIAPLPHGTHQQYGVDTRLTGGFHGSRRDGLHYRGRAVAHRATQREQESDQHRQTIAAQRNSGG